MHMKGDKSLSYYVRLMRKEDVAQVTEIDREAFPTNWPPPNYQHELRNRLAHYIVACDEEKTVDKPEVKASSERNLTGLASKSRWLFGWHHFFSNKMKVIFLKTGLPAIFMAFFTHQTGLNMVINQIDFFSFCTFLVGCIKECG